MHFSSFLTTLAVVGPSIVQGHWWNNQQAHGQKAQSHGSETQTLQKSQYPQSDSYSQASNYGKGRHASSYENYQYGDYSNVLKQRSEILEAIERREELIDELIYGRDAEASEDLDDSFAFSRRANPDIDIYVAFGKRRQANESLHWMLATRPVGSHDATIYHVTGGPSNKQPFKLEIQTGKHLHAHGIGGRDHLGKAKAADKDKITAAINEAPLPTGNNNCQNYLISVLQKLESKQLIKTGTATTYQAKLEKIQAPKETSTLAIVDGSDLPKQQPQTRSIDTDQDIFARAPSDYEYILSNYKRALQFFGPNSIERQPSVVHLDKLLMNKGIARRSRLSSLQNQGYQGVMPKNPESPLYQRTMNSNSKAKNRRALEILYSGY
jgi:hypothetical protein